LPALNGMMARIARLGQACAKAEAALRVSASKAIAPMPRKGCLVIGLILHGFRLGQLGRLRTAAAEAGA
jgi:hypothetical protein